MGRVPAASFYRLSGARGYHFKTAGFAIAGFAIICRDRARRDGLQRENESVVHVPRAQCTQVGLLSDRTLDFVQAPFQISTFRIVLNKGESALITACCSD
jgi:hypothetical protein